MRILVIAMTTLFSASAMAADLCSFYASNARYTSAIQAVADHQNYTITEFCNLPHVQQIEAQPSQVITREGDVIPHVRVQLHSAEYSCLFMVRDADKVITSSRCYSTF